MILLSLDRSEMFIAAVCHKQFRSYGAKVLRG